MKNFLVKSVLLIALLLIPSTSLAQEQQNPIDDYIAIGIECGEAFGAQDFEGVIECQEQLDTLIPQSCYLESWATFRTGVYLFNEAIATNDSALLTAAGFLFDKFAEGAQAAGEACTAYTVPEDVS